MPTVPARRWHASPARRCAGRSRCSARSRWSRPTRRLLRAARRATRCGRSRELHRPCRAHACSTSAAARATSPPRSPRRGRSLPRPSTPTSASSQPAERPAPAAVVAARHAAAAAHRRRSTWLLEQRPRARPGPGAAWPTRWSGSTRPGGLVFLSLHQLARRRGAGTRPRRGTTSAAQRAARRYERRLRPAAEEPVRREPVRGLGRPTACAGPATSRRRAASRRRPRYYPRWARGVRPGAGSARGRDLEPAARPAQTMTQPDRGRPRGPAPAPVRRSASCGGASAWSRWRSPRRPAGWWPTPSSTWSSTRRASSAGRCCAWDPHGGVRPAAEPGLRLPVPDGPVLPARPRWPQRPGLGGAAAVVGAAARRRLHRACCGWPGGWASARRPRGWSPPSPSR